MYIRGATSISDGVFCIVHYLSIDHLSVLEEPFPNPQKHKFNHTLGCINTTIPSYILQLQILSIRSTDTTSEKAYLALSQFSCLSKDKKKTFSKHVVGGCKESSLIFTASPLRPIRWLIITSSAAGKKDKVSNSNDHIFNSSQGERKEIDKERQTSNGHIIHHPHTSTHLLKSIFKLCNQYSCKLENLELHRAISGKGLLKDGSLFVRLFTRPALGLFLLEMKITIPSKYEHCSQDIIGDL